MFSIISLILSTSLSRQGKESTKKTEDNELKLDLENPTQSWVSVFNSLGIRVPFIQSVKDGQVHIMGLNPGNYTVSISTPEGIFRKQISIRK